MRLGELVAELAVTGLAPAMAQVEVGGVCHDSRRIAPGDLFVAWRGKKADGRGFIAEAVRRGAVAVLLDSEPPRPGESSASIPKLKVAVPWLVAANPRALLGPLAARLHGHPEQSLRLLGVTGTNGKSTTIALLAAIAEAAGWPCGLVGTLGYRFRDLTFPGDRTTPEGSDLLRDFAAMRDAGAQAVAMEVSSHALDQGRVDGLAFDLAVFTNLTRDHFDQHGDFATYYAAKRRLFDRLTPRGVAAVHLDDATAAGGDVLDGWGRRLAGELRPLLGKRLVTFAVDSTSGADVTVRAHHLDARGITATVATPRGDLEIRSRLLGAYNLENLLAAAAGAEALGLPHAAISEGLATVTPLPGRLEPVEAGQPFLAVIDYAHTPAALEAALVSVRAITGGKVAVVFGCGGNRDPSKREPMGRLAGRLADLAVVTSDNPRDEDPLSIIAAVELGLKAVGCRSYRIVPDRREAIRRTVAVLDGGWALVVAGKGHEAEQIVAGRRSPFSDRTELERALEERHGHALSR
jgi:UDP-N-acetylmuramoyl-L-alanyl-D-glutamate--2,6-diaminopimelate ligase